MTENKPATKADWVDPDDAPELTDAWFDTADVHKDGVLVRRGRGRPKVETPKRQITLRLDADVIDRFRATGPGWQARMNDALRKAV
ncbi:BrnA antitoxin family protein [Bosea sp. PAMC 26642]|uniref:BrnA antitoxin family protein n=1 Tax=Bosea sp. (strain PAMC 26642) TaxID=1792307 RepID=UPI0007701AC3|nr:BrnA antitoxin family protein [Bosea sp. PAMC 26642]AMJ61759.1 hypothetical protein AXW83_16895 [Bosea sp. PAMC 26642]